MSYINDALRKAQKEKKPDYDAFGQVVASSEAPPKKHSVALSMAGIFLIAACAAGMLVWMFWPMERSTFSAGPAVAVVAAPHPGQSLLADSAGLERPDVETPSSLTEGEAAAVDAAQAVSTATPPAVKATTASVAAKPKTEAVKRSEKSTKDDVEALYAQALKRHNERKLDAAETLYKKILQIDPRHLASINNLGVIYMTRKNYPKAVGCFEDALAVRADYVKAHYNLACVYARQNDVPRSLFYLKNAMDFNPDVRLWVAEDQDLKAVAASPEYRQMAEGRN